MSKLHPDLEQATAAGRRGPFAVRVTFTEAPAADDLAALGLVSAGPLAARGRLTAGAMTALAKLPQVSSIEPDPQADAAGEGQTGEESGSGGAAPPPERGGTSSPIATQLAEAMRRSPGGAFDVLVTFRRPPQPPPDVPGLYVSGDVGQGRLDCQAIERLAAREDVLAISEEPEDVPFAPG